MGELTDFFPTAWPLIDVLEVNFGRDLEPSLGFLVAESDFYPELKSLSRQLAVESHTKASYEESDQADGSSSRAEREFSHADVLEPLECRVHLGVGRHEYDRTVSTARQQHAIDVLAHRQWILERRSAAPGELI